MDQGRLIHAAKLNPDEQRCLEMVCTIMEKAENPAKRRETLQALGKPGQPSSARQKLFEELAAGLGKEALAGQVGRYLFEKADIGLCDRILLSQKSLKGCSADIMEQARKMAKQADGVIVGSAIVKLCGQYGKDCIPAVKEYVRRMKAAANG